MESIDQLNEMVHKSRHIVFFGGAGVSTESGIPDFRSTEGIFSIEFHRNVGPEEILSRHCLDTYPELFFSFFEEHLIYPEAQPNAAHRKLAELEEAGRLSAVITQNIDGLHQKAGSRNVLELHGNAYRYFCTDCGQKYDRDYIAGHSQDIVPRCETCGGIIRPDIVLYGERLDGSLLREAENQILGADMLIVAGTSLLVYPAATMTDFYSGHRFVILNRSPLETERNPDLFIQGDVGEIMSRMEV